MCGNNPRALRDGEENIYLFIFLFNVLLFFLHLFVFSFNIQMPLKECRYVRQYILKHFAIEL